jgi:hypothetical protein
MQAPSSACAHVPVGAALAYCPTLRCHPRRVPICPTKPPKIRDKNPVYSFARSMRSCAADTDESGSGFDEVVPALRRAVGRNGLISQAANPNIYHTHSGGTCESAAATEAESGGGGGGGGGDGGCPEQRDRPTLENEASRARHGHRPTGERNASRTAPDAETAFSGGDARGRVDCRQGCRAAWRERAHHPPLDERRTLYRRGAAADGCDVSGNVRFCPESSQLIDFAERTHSSAAEADGGPDHTQVKWRRREADHWRPGGARKCPLLSGNVR